MSTDQFTARKGVVAALAAAIVTARGAVEVPAIQAAWRDAENIAFPNTRDRAYKAWQREHGLTPTTAEEDARAQQVDAVRSAIENMVRY